MRELLPGWTLSRVGDLFDMQLGKMLSKDASAGPEQRQYLTNKNVQWNRIDFEALNYMSFSSAEREKFRLIPGDLLVTEGGEVGRTAMWEGEREECYFQKSLHRLRSRGQIEPRYMLHYMNYAARWQMFTDSVGQTSIAHLPQDKFAEHLIAHPVDLAIQRRIVTVIDTLAELERGIEASIAKHRATQSGMRESLLAQMDWDCPLSEALSGPLRNGFSPVESVRWTGVQMLGLGCLTPLGFAPVHLKNAPSSVSSSHAAVLSDGDVLMSRANTRELVGLVGVYQDVGTPCIYPDLMIRMRPSSRCSSQFLAIALMSDRARRTIRSMAQGTSESMVKISAGAVRELRIPLPDLKDQEYLLSTLDSVTNQLRKESAELVKLRRLKNGLVDDLLSGRVAVSAMAA
ncbi:restriction endonuclease subunit S [Streptomyces sp. NPDC057052]|uniref:restriction endonuclease subunit S n=1 Tax=Streptomyces sp. NPDC057052 TaxID=3346010 RepID=UPI003643AF46